MTSPVDDIMQKYMQKVSKSQARADLDPANRNFDKSSRSKSPETPDHSNENKNASRQVKYENFVTNLVEFYSKPPLIYLSDFVAMKLF